MQLIELDTKGQIQNNDFQDFVTKCKSFKEVWKRYYELPATDPRYADATMADVLEDLLRIKAHTFIAEWEDPENPKFAEWRKKRVTTPSFTEEWKKQMEADLNKQLQAFENLDGRS